MNAIFTLFVLTECHILLLSLRLDLQEAPQIVASIAVVRCRPNRHNVLVLEQLLIPFLHQLMSPCDQLQSVVMIEFVHHFRAKQPSHSSVVLGPSVDIFWVRPHKISKRALSWYLLKAVDLSDLVKSVNIGWQSSVDTKYFILISGEVLSTRAERGKKSKV